MSTVANYMKRENLGFNHVLVVCSSYAFQAVSLVIQGSSLPSQGCTSINNTRVNTTTP